MPQGFPSDGGPHAIRGASLTRDPCLNLAYFVTGTRARSGASGSQQDRSKDQSATDTREERGLVRQLRARAQWGELSANYARASGGCVVSWIEAERGRCRRPIATDEVPGLEALGGELRRLRWTVARLSRPALARRAEVSVRTLERIEQAIRRTRRSTLERIAAGLVEVCPRLGPSPALAAHLAELAGRGLAAESVYRERVEKRRRRRYARRGFRRFTSPRSAFRF